MRLLHTSDWHLGRSLHGVDLLEHQRQVHAWLVWAAVQHQVDAVLVSGDVFDRAVPPIEAVDLLEQTLAELSAHASVIVISGNHDSATRLGYGSRLFRDPLHIRTRVESIGSPVELSDEHGPVLVYPLPFLDPDIARGPLSEDKNEVVARSHEAVLGAAMARVRADIATRPGHARVVVMAHAFVTGGAASESERDIRVGGVDTCPVGVFNGVHYLALGHLHGPQLVSLVPSGDRGGGRLAVETHQARYSGSLLRYSFSEEYQNKSVAIVDLDASGVSAVELVPVPQPRAMLTLNGSLDELLASDHDTAAWVRAVCTDDVRPDRLVERLRLRFPHLLLVGHEPRRAAQVALAPLVSRDTERLGVVDRFVKHVTGRAITEPEQAQVAAAYESVLAAARKEA